MDWACSSNRETGKMNRTLVGKPFGMNRTEVSYEDLNWIEVAQDLVLALLLLLLSFFVSSVSLLFHLCSNVASNNTEHLLHTRFCRFRKIGKSDSYFVMFLCPSVRPSVFLPSVCLSVSVEWFGSHWTYFHEILCLKIYWKSVERIQILLISATNNGPHCGPGVDSASNRNEYQEYFLGGKGGRRVGLTTLPPSCADCHEIWEPQPPGTLRACPGL